MRLSNWLSRLNHRDTRIFPKFTIFSKYLIIAISVIAAFYTANSILAQTNILKDKQDAIKTGNNQESWLDEAMGSNIVSSVRLLTGDIPDDVLNGTATSWVPGGALGTTTNLVASVFTPQASGIQYIAQVKDNFLGKPAYAQGTGFVGLQPLLPIWRGFRNVIYLLASIIFIVMGIMIMLRIKISPQAVINIQNAIPQLITTLILVTFSYAIAGLLIDLTYLIQGLTISILFSSLGAPTSLLEPTTTQLAASAISSLFGGNYAAYSLSDLLTNNGFLQTFDLVSRLIPMGLITIIGGVLGGIIGGVFTMNPITAIGIGLISSVLVLLILLIIVFIKLLSLLFGLIKVYINILIKVILAPLEIGLGAFPGSKAGFNTWLWDLIANLLVFPFILLFLLLANIIMEKILAGGLWTPSLMGVAGAAFGGRLIAGLVGIGAFMIAAKLPEMIPQAIFAIKPSPWGAAIGEGMKAGDPRNNFLYKVGKGAAYNKTADSFEAGVGTTFAKARRFAQKTFGPGSEKQIADSIRQQGK